MSAIPNFPDGSLEKVYSNVLVPGVKRVAQWAYDQASPEVYGWAANKVKGGTKRGLDYVDSYFSGGSPYSSHMRPEFDSGGYTPAPDFQHWTQSTNATNASTMSRATNGQASSISMSDGVTVGAMFNPGRGAELGLVNKLIDAPINFKTGEHPGPASPVNAFNTQLQLYRGVKLAHSFAFKVNVPVQTFGSELLVNRGYVHNVFRHYNYLSMGVGGSAFDLMGPTKALWNNTLGPDSGSSRAFPLLPSADVSNLTNAGLNVSLKSPYRNPVSSTIMYSRISQQFVENVGWACHPFKYVQHEMNDGDSLGVTQPVVYKNCGTDHVKYVKSMPAQQPATPGTVIDTKIHASPFYYRSQQGKGKVSYDFSNDSTCPVVIDVVITKIKQGQAWNSRPIASTDVADTEGNQAMLDNAYKNGYMRMVSANSNFVGTAGLNGQQPVATDVLTNARVEFLPKAALKYAQNQPTNTGSVNENHDMPFKQVARDQFIISAGATRAWSFVLPALDYDARRYGNRSTTTLGSSTLGCLVDDVCCDFTYIVSIAYSAVSTPIFETPTGASAKSAIIDRRPGDCNVSITGVYEEYAHPVYLTRDTVTKAYINGGLDVPYYVTPPTTGTVVNQEIANLNQVVRGNTPGSALISVGAINTLPGA